MSKELKYKMKVRINQGFYEGVEGTLTKTDGINFYLDIGDEFILVKGEDIEII